jgi:hypothetical protein
MRCLNSWVVKRRAGNFQFVPLLSQAAFLSLSFSLCWLKVPCGPIMCLGNVRGEGKSRRKGVRRKSAFRESFCVNARAARIATFTKINCASFLLTRYAVRDGIKMCPVSIYLIQRQV